VWEAILLVIEQSQWALVLGYDEGYLIRFESRPPKPLANGNHQRCGCGFAAGGFVSAANGSESG
jgi:hypothetical protein